MRRDSRSQTGGPRASFNLPGFPVPDPRHWPSEIRAQLLALKRDPWVVVIFDFGDVASIFCEDAVAALALLDDVEPGQWSTAGGFPSLSFDAAEIEEYSRRFAACGFSVRLEREGYEQVATPTHRAEVIDIAAVRAQQLQKVKGATR